MISNPLDGITELNFESNVKVVLDASAKDMNDAGEFKLTVNFDVMGGAAEEFYLEFITDDCIDWELLGSGWVHTDYDGRRYKAKIEEGNYSTTINMDCLNMNRGTACSNSHEITVKVYGDNFDAVECKVKVNMPDIKADIPKDENVTGDNTLSEFYNAMSHYLSALSQLNDKDIITDEQMKKQQAMEIVKESFKFNPLKMLNAPKGNELDAMEQCVYMAIFDFYMAYKIQNDSNWFNKKYYDNISPEDFSDGGIKASTKIVEDTKSLVDELLKKETLTNTYQYKVGGKTYQYTITMTIPINSISVFTLGIEEDSGQKWTYTDTYYDNGMEKAQTAMANYVEELIELYSDANIGAFKLIVDDLNSLFEQYHGVTTYGGGTNYSIGDMEGINGKLKKLDKKIVNTLKKYGLSDLDKFFGYCWEVYDITKDYSEFAELCKDSDNIGTVAKKAKSHLEKMDKLLDSIRTDCAGNASTRLIKEAENRLKKALENLSSECNKYIDDHPDEFKSWIEKILHI